MFLDGKRLCVEVFFGFANLAFLCVLDVMMTNDGVGWGYGLDNLEGG